MPSTCLSHSHLSPFQVPPIACYCLASILMTLVNKVPQLVLLHRCKRLTDPLVCRFRSKLLHELSPTVHPVNCLLRLCVLRQETGNNILPRFRRPRCEAVVSDQFLACQRHLHRVKKPGEFSRLLDSSTPLSSRTAIPQHPRLHDIQEPHNYTDCMLLINPAVTEYLRLLQAYGEVIWFGGRVTGLTLVSFFFMVR